MKEFFLHSSRIQHCSREPNCRNDSPDLIVLVDEGHRTNSGQLHQQMKKALPNASFVAFTGTPLLKSEKVTTEEQFGPWFMPIPCKRQRGQNCSSIDL